MQKTLNTFIIHAPEDQEQLKKFKKHLNFLVLSEEIYVWDAGLILPGSEWDKEIKEKLESSDLILLFISADFFESDYIFRTELPKAIERHENKKCVIIPIYAKECPWNLIPNIAKIQGLPADGKAIFSHHEKIQDGVMTEIIQSIRQVIQKIREEYSLQIQPKFEETDIETDIETTEKQNENLKDTKKNHKTEDILTNFSHASHFLLFWKSDFQNLPNSHIQRSETAQIIQWIDGPLPGDEKGIALLVGDAGAGKSVILRDILIKMQARKTPVLGIKADQYRVESIAKLEERLHLQSSIEDMVKALVVEHERVVVLIDQIDALSQSLSARRVYLENFTNLVQSLAVIPKVRIVVSCRKYDLQNDQEFTFYRRQKTFQLGNLSTEDVNNTLQKLSKDLPKLPNDLMELLKTPLHLDVFCQIYRPNLAFEKITVLRDLYEELWAQKVIKTKSLEEIVVEPDKIEHLIFELAKKMNLDHGLVVPAKSFRVPFSQELLYLKSEDIVLERDEELLFFHQTFYDFAFAKQFIRDGMAVEKYLLNNDQNLHIRACLKMMLEFLREGDDRAEYLRVMHRILSGTEFYFHVKSLAISILGYVKKPFAEEMKLAKELIFPNSDLFKAFMASVKSQAWLLFLLEERQPQRLVESVPFGYELNQESQKRLLEILNGLIFRHLPENRHELLQFITNLPEVESKYWLVQNTLRSIKIWDNPLAFTLFETYSSKIPDEFIADLLEISAESDLNWTMEHLKKAIQKDQETKQSNFGKFRIEHSLGELIKHLIERFPETTFDVLLSIQLQRLNLRENIRQSNDSGPFLNDFPEFWIYIDEDRHNETELFPLIIRCVRELSQRQSMRFSQFISEHVESHSVTHLLILVEGFRANISNNTRKIVDFLSAFIEKGGVDATETLAWRVRKLLKEAFSSFTEDQKNNVILLISQIESRYEDSRAKANNRPDWIGVERYRWMRCLPENEISQIPAIALIFEELSQQFPNLEDEEPNKIRTYRVGPPLEQKEYDTMTLEDWKVSFAKFNEQFERDRWSEKGGSLEHARQFEIEVKKRPEYFIPLIKDLASNSDFPNKYLIYGLEALKEVKYATDQLLLIFKILITRLGEFGVFEIQRLISFCSVFANEKVEEDAVVDFLVNIALHHSDPEDNKIQTVVNNGEKDAVYISGHQTVRGSAVDLLPYFYYFKKQENQIFETLECVAENDLLMVKCQMMPRLALLTNLDMARSLRLFLRLIRDNEHAIMEHSAWSAQFFARQNFDGMGLYFENALSHPELYRNVSVILALTYVFERSDALDLLNRFLENNDDAKSGAIDVAAHNICNDDGIPMPRSLELFERFLEESSETVIHAYDMAFQHLKPSDFPYLQPILKRFSRTVIARKNPRPFYEYLIKCAKTQPEGCLELVENFAEYEKPSIQYHGFYDNEPLRVVLNAYQTLWGKEMKDHALLKKALQLFDAMLLDDRFRRDAETVLANIER